MTIAGQVIGRQEGVFLGLGGGFHCRGGGLCCRLHRSLLSRDSGYFSDFLDRSYLNDGLLGFLSLCGRLSGIFLYSRRNLFNYRRRQLIQLADRGFFLSDLERYGFLSLMTRGFHVRALVLMSGYLPSLN